MRLDQPEPRSRFHAAPEMPGGAAVSPPWMPLNIADYRKDTAHLSAAQHGAYLLLIMHYWHTGALPDDDRQLARVACMGDREWKRERRVIEPFFQSEWKHKRIDKELARASEITSKRRAAAQHRYCKPPANAGANAGANEPANGGSDAPYTRVPPSTKKGSEANASGADAPPAEPVYTDAKHRLYGEGGPILMSLGLDRDKARQMIGVWRKTVRDDCEQVLQAIIAARDHKVSDPIPWVTASLKTRVNSDAKAHQSVSSAAADLKLFVAERERERDARPVLAIGGSVLDGAPDEELHRRATG